MRYFMKLSTIFRPAVLFMAALMCICFTGCGKTPGASQTQIVLGTVVTVQVYGRQSQEALDGAVEAAMDRARELEQIFSLNIDSSEINYVNQNAAKAPVHVSDDFYTVLERSLYFARLTEGAFDPTLGKLIRLWGIGTDDARVPEPEEIAPLTGRRDYEHVLLDEQAHTVFFENDGFSLDFGAIAKGYAADEMKELLQEDYHIDSALLNLGGNIITIGNRPDGKPWTLGIADPSSPQPEEDPAVTLQVTDLTFVTSNTRSSVTMKPRTVPAITISWTVPPVIRQTADYPALRSLPNAPWMQTPFPQPPLCWVRKRPKSFFSP